MAGVTWELVRIPESCKGVDIVIGVDEAGRGPVLGPLVYAAAFWPLSEDEEIQKMGFNDSKQLKEGDRDGFFSSIRNHPSIGWVIEELTAADLSRVRFAPPCIFTEFLYLSTTIISSGYASRQSDFSKRVEL